MAARGTSLGGDVFVRLNGAALDSVLKGPNGLVVKDLIVRAERVKIEARRIAPVGKQHPGQKRKFPPGQLRDSLVKTIVTVAGDIGIIVGSSLDYAFYVHEGTRPHTIVPRKAPALVFFSERAGRVIVTKLVHHPGTQPNRFLTKALRVAA